MEWNIFYCLSDKIKTFNVFNHEHFLSDVLIFKQLYSDKEAFSEEIRKLAKYYFQFKSEYEIILADQPTNGEVVEQIIDVYDQLEINWDRFIEYIWNA